MRQGVSSRSRCRFGVGNGLKTKTWSLFMVPWNKDFKAPSEPRVFLGLRLIRNLLDWSGISHCFAEESMPISDFGGGRFRGSRRDLAGAG
jgi:hypothetical protein